MVSQEINRRSLLKQSSVLVTGTVGIAGCTEQSDSVQTPEERTESPISTATGVEDDVTDSVDTPEEKPTEEETDHEPDLRHLHSITGKTYPPDIEGVHARRFEWSAVGGEWWLDLNIPESLGKYYTARYGRSRNFNMYVSDPYGFDLIGFIADQFEKIGKRNNLSKRQVVDLAVGFVQQLNYTPDDVSTEFDQYTYYPVETLIERGGDCEDSSILLAAILRELGYECVLLALWDAEPAHMALGVKGDPSIEGTYYEYEGEQYYYVETTGDGYRIGDMPNWDGSTSAEIIEIHSHPTLVYEYGTSVEGSEVSVTLTVWNFGKKLARDVSFFAGFENESEVIRSQKEINLDSLQYDESVSEQLVLRPPGNETLRLSTIVGVDGNIHDLHRSDWRRPA